MIARVTAVLVVLAFLGGQIGSQPARASEMIFIPADAHAAADQAAAITNARELIAAGNIDEAIQQLELFVASHPDGTEAARFLGDLYYRQGNFARAEAIYRQLLAKNPRDKETHNRLGVVLAAQNHVDEAIAQFVSALPGTDSIRDLVILHLRKGDFEAYRSQMEREASSQPTDPDIQEEVGEIYNTIARPSDAILYFKRALDNDDTSIAAINGLGMAYLTLHQYDQAEQYFQRCLRLDSSNYACLDNMGAADLETGRYAQAQDVLDHAHRIAPERPEVLVNYGYLADVRGDWKRAVSYYVQAVSIDPYVPESYVNLGIDYERNGLYPLAQAALLRGVAAAPYDGRIHYLLGQAYAAQGQTALALQQLKLASQSFDPSIASIAQDATQRLQNSSVQATQ